MIRSCLIAFICCLVFISGTPVRGQKSIKKPERFHTTLMMADGHRIFGKLMGCTDTTLRVSHGIKEEDQFVFTEDDFHYSQINIIKISRSRKGPWIGLGVGAAAGMITGIILDAYSNTASAVNHIATGEKQEYTANGFVYGLLLGSTTGAVTGMIIDPGKKKYKFYVNGNYMQFNQHIDTIRKFVPVERL